MNTTAVATKPRIFRMVMIRLLSTINGETQHAAHTHEQAGPEQVGVPDNVIKARIGNHTVQQPGKRSTGNAQQHNGRNVRVKDSNFTWHGELLLALRPVRPPAFPAAIADRVKQYE